MSGSAGGNRIKRENVEETLQDYLDNVLSKYPKYVDSEITGSFYRTDKHDFGDIDLIVELRANDKAEVKKDLVKFFSTFPDDVIVPFKSESYKGKKALNTGEIVTILYPISGSNGYAQIDNIVSLSPEETRFKREFLNLPAIKQGLMLGLIKTVVLENPESAEGYIVSKALNHDEELEFNLSSSGLSLRLVKISPEFKTLDKTQIWHTTNWDVVEELLSDYDFSESFDTLLYKIKKTLKNPRSINRVKGVFRSMVSVKRGEIGTLKGREKEIALNKIEKL